MNSLFDMMGVDLFDNIERFKDKDVTIIVKYTDGYVREMSGTLHSLTREDHGKIITWHYILRCRIFGDILQEVSNTDVKRAIIRLHESCIEESYRDILGP